MDSCPFDRLATHIAACLALSFILSPMLTAQVPTAPAIDKLGISDTGIRPYGNYDGTDETVNLQNNNLNLSIPLLALPGRNGHNLDLRLTYDSSIWRLQYKWLPYPSLYWLAGWAVEKKYPSVAVGWNINWPTIISSSHLTYPTGAVGEAWTACDGATVVVLEDGSRHSFRNNPHCPRNLQIPIMDSEDSDGMTLDTSTFPGSSVLCKRDGTKIFFSNVPLSGDETAFGTTQLPPGLADKIVDAAGNGLSQVSSSSGMTITDTLGRIVSITSSGIEYLDVNGETQHTKFHFENKQFHAPFNIIGYAHSQNSGATFSEPLLTGVTLNEGSSEAQSWSFEYDSNGELSKIGYPHHGCTAYEYDAISRLVVESLPEAFYETSGLPLSLSTYLSSSSTAAPMQLEPDTQPQQLYASFPGVKTKYVAANGVCSSSSPRTAYSASPGTVNNGEMSITFPDGTVEKHTFSQSSIGQTENDHAVSAHERSVETTDSDGTILKAVNTEWTGEHSWDLPKTVTTTYLPASTNSVTKQTFQYHHLAVLYEPYIITDFGAVNSPQQPVVSDPGDRVLNSAESNVTYNFGTGHAGGVLQTVSTQYLDYTDSLGPRILGLPVSVVTSDGDQAFTSMYDYDDILPSAPSESPIVQWIDPGTSFRGRVNAVKRCVDVGSSIAPHACSQWLTTSYTYDRTGNITKITDPRGNTTNYTWKDHWGQDTCSPSLLPQSAGFGHAYLTKIENAVHQTVTSTYKSCSGQRHAITGVNEDVTSYRFDSLGRINKVLLPDGGDRTITYNDQANTVTFVSKIDSDKETRHRLTYDGIGHVTLTEDLNDPAGTSSVSTSYDGLGRLVSKTNPYRGAYSASLPFVGVEYDGLSRTRHVSQSDGTSSTDNDYSEFPCVTSRDEAAVEYKRCSDAVGRLVSVYEDPKELNSPTTYSYNAVGDLAGVHQEGRIRGFQYDGLSRLLTSINPETGTICYGTTTGGQAPNSSGSNCNADGYDGNGNLLHKTDALGLRIDYTYDALNRMVSKISPQDGNTSGHFVYDQGTNGVGRLSLEYVDGAAGTSYSYDPMGRVSGSQWYNYGANMADRISSPI